MLAQVEELPEASRGLEQTDPFLVPSQEHGPANTLIWNFYPIEWDNIFLLFKPLSL